MLANETRPFRFPLQRYVLALGVSAIGTGRVIGSLISVPLWHNVGFLANGVLAGGLSLLGALICLLLVREGESAADTEVYSPEVSDVAAG